MSIVPETRVGKIEFYEAKILPWTSSALAIGITVPSVTLLSSATLAARAAYNAHLSAIEASKAATQAFYDKVKAMHAGPGLGADMIQTIKTFAQTSNNPNVYVLAQIPAPSAPGITPPPGTPFDFTIGLLQTGAVELKWKCNNPDGTFGTIYEVKRKFNTPSSDFQFVGATGVKTFVDDTLPAGGGPSGSPIIYQITAVRSTAKGNPANFLVSFGITGGGGFSITTLSGQNAAENRLAA